MTPSDNTDCSPVFMGLRRSPGQTAQREHFVGKFCYILLNIDSQDLSEQHWTLDQDDHEADHWLHREPSSVN